ncbi:MAG: hypothetical protein IPQ04_00775 [Saprospiraceae bacterium]|nr:hypothetical protein [Saprospiraceae bacterium]
MNLNFDHIIQQKLKSFERTSEQPMADAGSEAFIGFSDTEMGQNQIDNTAGMNFDFFSDKLNNAFGEKSFDTVISNNISNFDGGNIGLDFSKVENHLQNFDSSSNFDQAIVASVSNFNSVDLTGMNFDNFKLDLSKAENINEFDGRVNEAVANTNIYTDGLDYDSFEDKWKYSEFDQICRQRLNFFTPEIVSGIDFERVSSSLDDQKVQKFDHLVVDALSGLSINSKGDFDSFENKLQDSSEIKIQAFDYLIDQKVGDFVPTIEEKNFDAFYARLNSTIKNNSQAFDNAVKSNIESKLDKTIGRSWDGMEKVIQLEKSRRFKILAVKLVEAAVFLLAIFTYLNYQPTIGKWQKKSVATVQNTVEKQIDVDKQKSISIDKYNSNKNEALSYSSKKVDDLVGIKENVSGSSDIKSDIDKNFSAKDLSQQGQNSLPDTKSSSKIEESDAKITVGTDVIVTNRKSAILSSKVNGNNTKSHIASNSIVEEKGVAGITNTEKETIRVAKSNMSKTDAITVASDKATSANNLKTKESGNVSAGNSYTNSNNSSVPMVSTNQDSKISLDTDAKKILGKNADDLVSSGNSKDLVTNQSNSSSTENTNKEIDESTASSAITLQKGTSSAAAASKSSVLTMLDKKVLSELFVSNNAESQLNNLKLPSRKNIVSTLNGNKKISGQSPTGLVYYAEVFGGGNTLIIPPPDASVNDANLVKSLIGQQFGFKLGAQKNKFNVESGIQYSINKLNEKRIKLNFESINIPISAGYTISVNDRIKINVIAGVGLNIITWSQFDRNMTMDSIVNVFSTANSSFVQELKQHSVIYRENYSNGIMTLDSFKESSYLTLHGGLNLQYILPDRKTLLVLSGRYSTATRKYAEILPKLNSVEINLGLRRNF